MRKDRPRPEWVRAARASLTASVVGVAVVAVAVAHAQEPAAVPPENGQDSDYEETYGYQYLEDVVIGEALEKVLSRPEFARLRIEPEEPEASETPGWVERFLDWLDDWLGTREAREQRRDTQWFPGLPLLDLLVYGAAAALFAFLILYVVKAIVGSRSSKKLNVSTGTQTPVFRADRAPGEMAPNEYWQRALALARASDYRRAVREILLASMSTLERRGSIRFRKGLTNRDYLYAARGVPRDAFAVIARSFELIYFGRREATAESFRECKRAFERGFPREAGLEKETAT